MIQAGIRTYPKRVGFPVYLKSGLALSFPYPALVTGLGYDLILSDKFSIYPETELYYSGFKSTAFYSISLGLSLFHWYGFSNRIAYKYKKTVHKDSLFFLTYPAETELYFFVQKQN